MTKHTHQKNQFSVKDIKRSFYTLVFYIVLIAVTTRLAVSFHYEYLNYYNSAVRAFLVENLSHNLSYDRIVTNTDWWNYLERIIDAHLYNKDSDEIVTPTEKEHAGHNHSKIVFKAFWSDNLVIGKPKLRQIRVAENTCIVHEIFNRYFNNCYASYERKYEYKNESFKGVPYKTYEQYPVDPIKGHIAKYIGPGYVQNMTYNRTKNLEIIADLKNKKWIDRGTRIIVFELIFFNINFDTFAIVQFFGEKLSTGNILAHYYIRFLPVFCVFDDEKYTTIILGSLFYAIAIYVLSSNIWTLIRNGFYNYVRRKWNWVNVLYVFIAQCAIYYAYKHKTGMNNLIKDLNRHKEEIFLDNLINTYFSLKLLVLSCTVLAWIMAFRFIGFNTTMMNFSIALRKGYPGIFGFSLMFMVVFFAFAAMGMILFCKGNIAFSTFSDSMITMMRMVMIDFQYDNLERADDIIGPLFFIFFIFFMFFVLLNTFLAVIGDSYVSTRQKDPVGFSILRSYIKYACDTILNWIIKGKEYKRRRTSSLEPKKNELNFPEVIKKDDIEETTEQTHKRAEENKVHKWIITEQHKGVDRISAHVKRLEEETELLIEKMDRILQKLDGIANKNTND